MIKLIGYIHIQKYNDSRSSCSQWMQIFFLGCDVETLWHYILWEKVIFESKLFLNQMGRKEREATVSNNIPLKNLSFLGVPSRCNE